MKVRRTSKKPSSEEVSSYLETLLSYWQPMLRLDNWQVDVELVPLVAEDEVQDFWAKIRHSPSLLHADVDIVNIFESPEHTVMDSWLNIELSLVHELLHLRYDWISLDLDSNNKALWNSYEAATELTSRALVASRYGLDRISNSL